jgi:multiple sugar transport system substrate-binding protein
MFVSGPWHIGLIETAGGADIEGKWAVVALPGKDGPPGVSWVGGSNLVVYKDSANKDAAWAFVEYLSRPATQVTWYGEATVLPAVQAAWDDPAIAGDPSVAVFGEQLASTNAPPPVTTWNEIGTAINEQLERVTAGETSPEEGAQAMQQAAETIGTGG